MNVKNYKCEFCACYKAKNGCCWALTKIPEKDCKFYAPVTEKYRHKKSGYILNKDEDARLIEGTKQFAVIKKKEML